MAINAINTTTYNPSAKQSNNSSDKGNASFLDALAKTNNAPLDKAEAQRKLDALAMKRINEVGIAAYAQEQKQIKKMMDFLEFLRDGAPKDIRNKLENVIGHFKENPPETIADIVQHLKKVANNIPHDAPKNLYARMQKLVEEITDLMSDPNASLNDIINKAKARNIEGTRGESQKT